MVVESGRWEHLQDLLRVTRTRLPDVSIFVVDEVDGTTLLMDVTNSRPDAVTPPQPDPPPSSVTMDSKPDPAPFLRYTGSPDPEPEAPPEEAEPAETAPDDTEADESSVKTHPEDPPDRTLTPEELDSLLGRSDDHEE